MSDPLEEPKWKDLKDIYLAKKQGEALERITKPKTHYEGLGLGYYGPTTVLALCAIDLFEDVLNELVELGLKEDPEALAEFRQSPDYNVLHVFTEEIAVASGSREAKRMEKGLETIGLLGQYIPFGARQPLQPEQVDLNK